MGRTIPSFRIASKMEYGEWKNFRRALSKVDRKLFDNMFFISVLYNSACVCCANPIRIQPIIMSILFQHYKELKTLNDTFRFGITNCNEIDFDLLNKHKRHVVVHHRDLLGYLGPG
jgi:hypothetical protein